MLSVSAAEFSENFGRYREAAERGPVAIVSDGTTSGYFIAPAEFEAYERLKVQAREASAIRDAPAREPTDPSDDGSTGRPENLADIARRLFGPEGGVELDLPPRGPGREPPDFA